MQSFPSNNSEFAELLRSSDVDVQAWVGSEFSRADVLKFLFLRGLWEIAHGATRKVFEPGVIDREKAKAQTIPNHKIDPSIVLLERMLNAGFSPEEISSFVTAHRMEAVHQILYFLDDPACVYSRDIADNMRFHIYTEDESERPIPESRDDWTALFQWLGYVGSR